MGNVFFIEKQLKLLVKFLDDVKSFYEIEVFFIDFFNIFIVQQEINSYVVK